MKKYKYVRRISDGVVLDIPEDQLAETLRRGGFKEMPDVTVNTGFPMEELYKDQPLAEVPNTPVVAPETLMQCPLCEYQAKTEQGLKVHKARKHV